MASTIGSIFKVQIAQLQKVKMSEVTFDLEKNFFQKINVIQQIAKSPESSENEKFFKLKMIVDPILYQAVVDYCRKAIVFSQ